MNDLELLVSRIVLGGGMAAHGAQKAFGAFEGPGRQGAAAYLESLGFSPGDRYASAASWTELGSGTLIALGLGGPLGPAALISTMVVAQASVHVKNGFFAQKNGIELGTIYSAGALALASAGFGRFSIDEVLGWQKRRAPWFTALAIAGGIAAGCLILTRRTPPEPAPPSAAADEEFARASEHIAAGDERPVPADRLTAADGNAASQA
jgi:putative oxidoreductase